MMRRNVRQAFHREQNELRLRLATSIPAA